MSEKPAPRFFDSTVAILATQVSGIVAVFFINLIISRKFGEAGKGYVSLILYTSEILFSIANLALGFSTQYFQSKQQESLRALFSNIVVFSSIAGILVLGAFLATYEWWRTFFQDLALVALVPSFVQVMGLLIHEPASQFLVGLFRNGGRAIVVLSQRYFVLAGLLIFLLFGYVNLDAVIWLYPISYILSSVAAFFIIGRLVGSPTNPSWRLFKKTMHYGWWIYLSNLLAQLYVHTDFYLLSYLGTIEDAGVYSVASGLTVPLAMVGISVGTIFYPKTASSSDADAAVSTPFYYRQVLLVMFVSSIFLAVCAYPVLLWYGPGFTRGLSAMFILLLAASLKAASSVLALHILGRGKSYVRSLSMLAALVVAVVMNLLLIPVWGLNGAALAMTLAMLSENIILTILYSRLVGGSVVQLYRFRRSDFSAIYLALRELLSRIRTSANSR